jgi:elongation factor Ts
VDVKASDVKALREKTGAGMLDCKKALVEAGGDIDKAVKKLKELGLAAAAKRSGRATNEGRVFSLIYSSPGSGIKKAGILELSCETDFVARNSDFIALGNKMVTSVIEKELSAGAPELETMLQEAISTIKENMSIRRFETIEIGKNELVLDYIHGEGRIGVLVKIAVENESYLTDDRVKAFAFDCALHIAAFNPGYLSRDTVDKNYIDEQEAIFQKQAENLDKPEKVIVGIVKGKLNKHLAGICLLDQPFVKDEKLSVKKVSENLSKECGGSITISDYKYYRVGEEFNN